MPPDRARRRFRVVPFALVLVATVLAGVMVGAVEATPSSVPVAAPVTVPFTAVVAEQRAGTPQLPTPEPTAAESKAVAQEVLARPEFQEPPKSIFERAINWFLEQLGKIVQSGGGAFGGAGAWIVLILLFGVVAFLVSRMQGGARFRGDGDGYQFDLEDQRSPADWIADAQRHEAALEWKAALRCRYRALIGSLIDLGAVRGLPGRTTGEYRVELRRYVPGAAESFHEASRLFESAWYGDEPTGAAENQRFQSLAADVIQRTERAQRDRDETRDADTIGAR